MSAAQTAPAWADLYMACLTLDEDGDVVGVNADQWHALDEVRTTLGEPFPMEVARLSQRRRALSAWHYRGVYLLRGGAINRLLACDMAEHILHIYESSHPGDDRPHRLIETVRAYAVGKASEEDLASVRGEADRVIESAYSCAWAASGREAMHASDVAGISALRSAAFDAENNGKSANEARALEHEWQIERTALYVAGVLP